MAKVVAINGSPRSKWNTGTLVREAARGAEEAGAQVEVVDLYRLEHFTGCISCFGCKRLDGDHVCIVKDGLAPVLQSIREADALILGSPVYLGEMTAAFRALYERLIFQYITYKTEIPSYNPKSIPCLFIVDSNAPYEAFDPGPYGAMVESYVNTMNGFVGPTQTLVVTETRQVKDYTPYEWTFFDAPARQERHETQFPQECAKAYEMGAELVR